MLAHKIMFFLGVINFILIVMQLLTGLRVIKINFKIHKISGVALVFSATFHALLAMRPDLFS